MALQNSCPGSQVGKEASLALAGPGSCTGEESPEASFSLPNSILQGTLQIFPLLAP